MNICFMTPCLFSQGGVQRVLTCLSNELVSRGHNITILTIDPPSNENRLLYGLDKRIKVEFVPNVFAIEYVRRLLRKAIHISGKLKAVPVLWDEIFLSKRECKIWEEYLQHDEYDCVIALHGRLSCVLGKITTKLDLKRTIGWQHSSYEAYFETKGNKTGYWNEDFLFDKYLKKLNTVVVLNEHDRVRYQQRFGINCVSMPNPVSFSSDRKSTLKTHRFVAIGSLRYAKGFDLLIESFSYFHHDFPDWKLDIYGEGVEKPKLEKMIEDLKVEGIVRLNGWTNKVKHELLNASGFLLSSRWEGMPMVILEAQECGLPVVAYNITAVEPLISNGENGILVDAFDPKEYADGMRFLAKSYADRRKMGTYASETVRQFSIDVISDRWEKMLVCDQKSR